MRCEFLYINLQPDSERDSGTLHTPKQPDAIYKMKTKKNLEKAQESNVNGVNNNANAEAPSQSNNNETRAKRSGRKYRPQPVYQVVRMAHRLFDSQLVKSDETKTLCMEEALVKATNLYPDKLRFALDFKAERDRLLDSIRFTKSCEKIGLQPEYVADHIVFEGKATLTRVQQEGIESLGQMVMMFRKPLFRDEYGLYSSNKSNEEVPND